MSKKRKNPWKLILALRLVSQENDRVTELRVAACSSILSFSFNFLMDVSFPAIWLGSKYTFFSLLMNLRNSFSMGNVTSLLQWLIKFRTQTISWLILIEFKISKGAQLTAFCLYLSGCIGREIVQSRSNNCNWWSCGWKYIYVGLGPGCWWFLCCYYRVVDGGLYLWRYWTLWCLWFCQKLDVFLYEWVW